MISTKFFHECDPFLDGATKRDIGVTGHSDSCVDPYYLVHRAEELGYHPQVILAGRAINDSMPAHVAGMMIRGLNEAGKVIKGSRVLIMGLAYKENVADIRESPARGIVEGLSDFGVEVYGWDPLLGKDEIEGFGVRALDDMLQITDYCPKGKTATPSVIGDR